MFHLVTWSISILSICLTPAVHGLHFSSNPRPEALHKSNFSHESNWSYRANLSEEAQAAYQRWKSCPPRIPIGSPAAPPVNLLNISWPEEVQTIRSFFGNAAAYPKRTCVQPPPIDNSYCQLSVCTHSGALVPRLFVDLLDDEEGVGMLNIIEGMLVANANGMNFGGVLGHPDNETFTTYSTFNNEFIMQEFFHLTMSGHLQWRGPPPCFKKEYSSVKALEAHRFQLKDGENVYLPQVKDIAIENYEDYLDSEFLAEIRAEFTRFELTYKPYELTVAMHVIRSAKPWAANDNRNNYYYELIKHIRKMYPSADIHVWSSKFVGMYRLWNTSDLDGFESEGITVHLEECELMDTWAHMVFAHIFVMPPKPTSFSVVPAILNTNCVVYSKPESERFGAMKRKHVLGNDIKNANFDDNLRACIAGYPPHCPGCTSSTRTTETETTTTVRTSTTRTTTLTLAIR